MCEHLLVIDYLIKENKWYDYIIKQDFLPPIFLIL